MMDKKDMMRTLDRDQRALDIQVKVAAREAHESGKYNSLIGLLKAREMNRELRTRLENMEG